MTGSLRHLTLAGGLLLAAVLCVIVVTHPSNSTAANVEEQDNLAVARLAEEYPVLRQVQRAVEKPQSIDPRLAGLFDGMPEAIVHRARVMNRNEDRTLVLIPRRDGLVCLAALFADGASGANCNTSGVSPLLATYGAAIGTVPASVEDVTFTMDDGSTRSVVPRDGLYYAPANAAKVSYESGGETTTAEFMPASSTPAEVQSTLASSLTVP